MFLLNRSAIIVGARRQICDILTRQQHFSSVQCKKSSDKDVITKLQDILGVFESIGSRIQRSPKTRLQQPTTRHTTTPLENLSMTTRDIAVVPAASLHPELSGRHFF